MTLEQSESLRHVMLNFLAVRHACAFSARQIEVRLKAERLVDFDFAPRDVSDNCSLLVKMDLIAALPDTLGATPYYEATAAGVLASERWRMERGLQ